MLIDCVFSNLVIRQPIDISWLSAHGFVYVLAEGITGDLGCCKRLKCCILHDIGDMGLLFSSKYVHKTATTLKYLNLDMRLLYLKCPSLAMSAASICQVFCLSHIRYGFRTVVKHL